MWFGTGKIHENVENPLIGRNLSISVFGVGGLIDTLAEGGDVR
jgi:hypothetical protein